MTQPPHDPDQPPVWGATPPVPPPPNPYAPQPYAQNPYGQQPYGYHPYAPPAPSGLYQAAAIVNWIVLGLIVVGTCGLGIVAAAWFIPMTINIQKGAKDGRKHTALAVCTLVFCNLVSGILMLIDDGNRPA